MSPLLFLKNEIIKNKLDAILISSVPDIIYLTNFSHFSQIEREAYLLITQSKNYILTDGRYSEAVKNKVKNFKLIEISSKNPFIKFLKNLRTKHNIKKLGIDEDDLTVDEYKKLTKHHNDTYHYSGIKLLRNIKDGNEIKNIEKACKLGDKTFKYILNKIKLGISEIELAFEIEFFIKRNGCDISFPPIVAFGKNSAIPHHKTSNQLFEPERQSRRRLATSGQFVLLDFGVKLNNYCSDMTRTVFFGKPNTEQKRMYQTVLEAQKIAIDYLASHLGGGRMDSSEVDRVARNYITSQGYPTIPHSLGHGIGLEVHESPHLSPKSKDILKPGMVFTIEPGIYLPGFGGVRIEDVVALEKSGPRVITKTASQIIELNY